MRNTFSRQFSLTAGMILLSFLILGLGFLSMIYTYMVDEKQVALEEAADAVVQYASASSLSDNSDGWNLPMSITFAAEVSTNKIIICDTAGTVTLCSCGTLLCEHVGKSVGADLTAYVMDTGQIYTAGTLGIYDAGHYICGKTITSLETGAVTGLVFVSSASREISGMLYRFSSIFGFSAVLVMVLAFVVTYFAAKRSSQPIKEISEAARRFAHGDFSVRVRDYGSHDEISELASAFNNMAYSLEKSESSRQEFTANVSHELKTPMTTIAGYVDGIIDGTIPPEKQDEYLKIVSSETRRLNRLVRKILDVSQIQEGVKNPKLDKFDVSELLGQVLLSFEGKINDKNLGVDTEFPDSSVMVNSDYDDITQVIYNLIDNAVKFADEGSVLRLKISRKGGKVYVSVINHGPTIDPAELPLIFERFHKTDRSRSVDRDGVGLGLYIVKAILGNLDEDIYVSSENGVTEFRFTLDAGK